jgi:magnesium transporter
MTVRAMLLGDEARDLTHEEAVAAFHRGDGLLWIHVHVREDGDALQLLRGELEFHALHVEDALSPYERPALHVEGNSLFLVATSVLGRPEGEVYEEIGLFVGPHYVVSVIRKPVDVLESWFEVCRQRPKSAGESPGLLLHAILDEVIDGFFPVVDAISDQIDSYEESVFSGTGLEISSALKLKRRLLKMRQQLAPMRDILNGLLRRDVPLVSGDVRAYLQDVYDHVLRLTEVIDTERDVLTAVVEADLSVTSNHLNEVMKRMTVISTVLMTAALVAGIYGMNFHHMPELQTPWGYPIALAAMLVLGLLELWAFKKVGWL